MKYNFVTILSLLLCLTSCDFGGGHDEVHIIGQYYVGWIDDEANRAIYFKEVPESNSGQIIVSSYVFAVGNNDRYIVAKSLSNPKSTVDHYHIIDTKGYYHTNMDNNNYWEFSSEAEFHRKLKALRISTIDFDKNYRKNPWQ